MCCGPHLNLTGVIRSVATLKTLTAGFRSRRSGLHAYSWQSVSLVQAERGQQVELGTYCRSGLRHALRANLRRCLGPLSGLEGLDVRGSTVTDCPLCGPPHRVTEVISGYELLPEPRSRADSRHRPSLFPAK